MPVLKLKCKQLKGGDVLTTLKLSLDSIDKIKAFVNIVSGYPYDFDLSSGRYVVDAKSIMGILSLDLSEPVALSIHAADGIDELKEQLTPFLV